MESRDLYRDFSKAYGGPVRLDEKLSAYTTFGTGGLADALIEVTETDQLARAVTLARQLSIPFYIIGEGSNLLISDNGYRGLIIRNSVQRREVQEHSLCIGAGENLDKTVDFATDCSLTGLEFAAGIWGSVGGAVYGNAGAFGSQISSVLKEAVLIDREGNVRREANDYFRFAYRHSYLKVTGEIVAEVVLELQPGDREAISRRVEEIREVRRGKHPETACSAGCFFKNIEDISQPHGKLAAGKLLDEVGAKTISVGSAGVFDRHANILINKGGASSKDIRALADILKKKVKDQFGLELIEEVICLGDF
ncbi:MAG: UDP-N-acetylmuramate dehydrogenase [Candidatus Zixiibacteriota bacterium]